MKTTSSKKIKIAIVAPSMKLLGGQSIQAQRLIEAFSKDEEIELKLIPNNPDLGIFGFLQKIPFVKTVANSIKFWQSLLTQIYKFDKVHIFSSGTTSYIISTIPPLLTAKLCGRKSILHYHHGGLEEHLNEWKFTAKPTMKMFDEIVVPSKFLVEIFARYGFKAKAISNFVETEKFQFRKRRPLKPVFLSNRNFEPIYNVECILKAFHLIHQRIPEAELIVAGCGTEETKLKSLAGNLSLRNVDFVGKISNEKMPEIYSRADIYLNASLVDNMPLSFIEAFSCGLPVVSTDAGGIPYLVKNRETGILVGKNDFQALAEKSLELLNSDDLAQRIIANAKREADKYSLMNVKERWKEFYQ